MKKINSFLIASLCTVFFHAHAQNTIFLSQGKIEFEKKINVYAQIDDEGDETWADLVKKMSPKFKSAYFDLTFNAGITLYKPGRENPDNNRSWETPADDNTVFMELTSQHTVCEKNIFGEKFLVQDSTRKIKWKITDETKNIAGFECRRANALIMDSIYVVAFYTDEITTSGGPESFSGLPGMILGVAIPHEHITWFATKVNAEDVPINTLVPPVKGKKVTNKAMFLELKDALKSQDKKWVDHYIKQAML